MIPIEKAFSKKHALVVDDGAVDRLAGKSMLEKLGFSVATAASGEEALHVLDRNPADLVLCDISMEGMGGITLLETTRERPKPPVFIMSTSYNDADHAVASLRSGAYGYLTKPLRFDSLQQTVMEVMDRFHQEQEAAHQKTQLTQYDQLTGLINKNEFTRRLAERLQRLSTPTPAGGLLFVKIAGLNYINHSYGHAEGDKALKFSAQTLAGMVRPDDLLARFSGDTYSLYFDDIACAQMESRIKEVLDKLEHTSMIIAGEPFIFTVLAGGACVQPMLKVEDLLNRADFSLRLARDHSHNRIHIYSEADEEHKHTLSHQLNLLAQARAALDNPQRIAMYYQPIVDLKTGHVSHFEALVRILDEDRNLCNTGELVKVCEVFGLVGQLDRTVIKTSLQDLQQMPAGTSIAINLSGKSIDDPDLLEFIENEMKAFNIDPTRIIFELTETAAFHNLDEVRLFVQRIQNLGCRFALDDFGVGFSSFYYIKALDFDYLKLDGSFIANLPHSPNDQVFVQAMVEISRVFGMAVVAEWVEDQATADMLREFGVTYGQGYHFGKPKPFVL